MSWEYRVVRRMVDGENYSFAIHEVYEGTSITQDEIAPYGDSLEDLQWVLNEMQKALGKPILRYEDFQDEEQ